MRTKDGIRYSMLVALCLTAFIMLPGCSKGDMEVVIMDGNTKTQVMINSGETVEQALQRAEISVNEQDVITPELGTALTDAGSEVTISRCAKVTVNDGENETELTLTGKTVQDALDELNIELGEHDYLNHSLGAVLTDGMDISIIRRKAVTISVDGEKTECLTQAKDVASLLEEQNIALDKKDRISPANTTELKEGTKVVIERVSVKEITEKEAIAFDTKTEYSDSMYSDETVEKTAGVEGEKEVTYQVTYVDGKEESRKAVSEKVIKEPVDRVVTQGTMQRRRVVSQQKVEDCDGSGHGYYIITWSDGTVEYKDY